MRRADHSSREVLPSVVRRCGSPGPLGAAASKTNTIRKRRPRWPRGLTRWSAAARLLRLWVRIPPGSWMSLVSVVCFQVKVSALGLSLVHNNPTECGVSE